MKNFKKATLISILFFPVFLSAQLTYPTKYPTAVIPHPSDGHVLFFGYMPMQYYHYTGGAIDTFKLYYIRSGSTGGYYLARSINYGITWTDTQAVSTLGFRESVVKYPDSSINYMAAHTWKRVSPDNDKHSYFCISKSTNGGYTFLDTVTIMKLGEDKSFIWNEDTHEFWGYVRPRDIEPSCFNTPTHGNGVRKIALMKNSGYFRNALDWSARDTIFEVDPSDYTNSSSPDYRTQPYYMQVFRNGSDWWGLVGMYRVGNNGGENNNIPYTFPEYTSDVELLWSDNGIKWYRTNNRQPIIPLHDSIKTIYSVGTVVNDSVYIYSFESTLLHAPYTTATCDINSRQDSAINGKYYSIYLYKISNNKLNEWRPPSIVNVTSTVEGFLDTAVNRLNLRDTITAELRDTASPYSAVSTISAVIDSVTFQGKFNFPYVSPGKYYLTLEGRNSLETWSASGIQIVNDSSTSYNFTTSDTKAYGGNLVLKKTKYCIYSGDVNNDHFIDLTDINLIYNDANSFVTGYVDTDVNGDNITELTDLSIAYNNYLNFVSVISP